MKLERHCTLGEGEVRYWQDVSTWILSSVKQSKFMGISLWNGGEERAEKFVLNGKYNRQPLLVMKDMKDVGHAFFGVLSWTFCLRHKTMKDFKRLQLIPSYLYYLLKSSKRFSLSSKLEKIYCASVIFLRLEIPSYLPVSTSIPATQ